MYDYITQPISIRRLGCVLKRNYLIINLCVSQDAGVK
jgi:hypothetical protein